MMQDAIIWNESGTEYVFVGQIEKIYIHDMTYQDGWSLKAKLRSGRKFTILDRGTEEAALEELRDSATYFNQLDPDIWVGAREAREEAEEIESLEASGTCGN